MSPSSYAPTLEYSSFKQLTDTSSHTRWLQIQTLGYTGRISQTIRVFKHADRAISVEQEVKEETGSYGGQAREAECEK